MNALYAFMRLTDDLADETGEVAVKRRQLAAWREGLLAALDGTFTHPIHSALVETIRTFDISPQHLLDVIDGVESDLEPTRFATFAELYPYCYRVASAVGLACVRVWGLRSGTQAAEAARAAEAAGIAFQLTNILRDVGEDLARGRVYLPSDEMAAFGCPSQAWKDAKSHDAFQAMMHFQSARARDFYRQAEPLDGLLTTDGRAIFRVMCGTYRRLLEEIELGGFAVLNGRVRVPRWRKGLILLRGWATKWGWV
jgi:phytoene synthase